MGWTKMTAEESINSTMPIAISIAPPADYTSFTGSQAKAGDVDLVARFLRIGRRVPRNAHTAVRRSGSTCLAVAVALPGSIPNQVPGDGPLRSRTGGDITFGHPSGEMTVAQSRSRSRQVRPARSHVGAAGARRRRTSRNCTNNPRSGRATGPACPTRRANSSRGGSPPHAGRAPYRILPAGASFAPRDRRQAHLSRATGKGACRCDLLQARSGDEIRSSGANRAARHRTSSRKTRLKR
jgi:hypothetical protein